jgi:hypothetical protein
MGFGSLERLREIALRPTTLLETEALIAANRLNEGGATRTRLQRNSRRRRDPFHLTQVGMLPMFDTTERNSGDLAALLEGIRQ